MYRSPLKRRHFTLERFVVTQGRRSYQFLKNLVRGNVIDRGSRVHNFSIFKKTGTLSCMSISALNNRWTPLGVVPFFWRRIDQSGIHPRVQDRILDSIIQYWIHFKNPALNYSSQSIDSSWQILHWNIFCALFTTFSLDSAKLRSLS